LESLENRELLSGLTFTGNVANDFNPATNPGVVVIPHSDVPVHIDQIEWMNQAGLVSGWNIKDIRLDYDPTHDTMYVGVNTFGIAGDVDGKGLIGKPDPQLTDSGGSNPANFGGGKAMAVGFAPLNGVFDRNAPPAPVIVAGVSGVKAQAGAGLDGFSVAKGKGDGQAPYDLVSSFGARIPNSGNLAFDPSAAHPGFEFTITNFSKITGTNPANGFVVTVQDGSLGSVVTGFDHLVSPVEARVGAPSLVAMKPAAMISANGTNVSASYTITGGNLASAGTIDFYWATGRYVSDEIVTLKTPIKVSTAKQASKTPYTASTLITNLGPEPANASYIIAVADSPNADAAHNVAFVSLPPPHISILSFAKNSANIPLNSNGDYDLTYRVSSFVLPDNPNLILAEYWATGTTAASIIRETPPVATDRLDQAIGTHTFSIPIAKLINPPAAAKNLVAVLDNNHVLPPSEESNSVVPIDPFNSPYADTGIDARLSFELQVVVRPP